MARRGEMIVDVEPRSYGDLLSMLNKLPRDVQNEVRNAARDVSLMLKHELQKSAAHSPTPQARLVAESMTTPRDRMPKVAIGGPKKVGRAYRERTTKKKKRAPAGALLWGSEHGSRSGTDRRGRTYSGRYVAGHNSLGYWIHPALMHALPIARDRYETIVNQIVSRYSSGE